MQSAFDRSPNLSALPYFIELVFVNGLVSEHVEHLAGAVLALVALNVPQHANSEK